MKSMTFPPEYVKEVIASTLAQQIEYNTAPPLTATRFSNYLLF